ncbi:DNA cytosine methyltransferase [Arthrobacter sp. C9C5]|uniref:DNA cytosine methyltransferase n=1 Tax=Arthrobacter sp. C9C5 TaxID=2735267 RepID=UPI001C2F5B16|nr:DNA cytosine methyltransferase [Arthrobacter sp. C9C5]
MGSIPIVDIFAGPGGLGEGFGALTLNGGNVFESVAAIEMESSAHSTLTLRHAFRDLDRRGRVPNVYYRFARGEVEYQALWDDPEMGAALDRASKRVHRLELGEDTRAESDALIKETLQGEDNWVLVGGPPCQAYSLVGRSRRANDEAFEEDKKHFLYREYLHIITTFLPSVFVMENVKGLLSSTHGGQPMFERILDDLRNIGGEAEYEIFSLTKPGSPETLNPKDFIIRAEEFGVPQQRHRVILLGIRKDLGRKPRTLVRADTQVTVRDAIHDMPAIRSRISKGIDSAANWVSLRADANDALADDGIAALTYLNDPGPLSNDFIHTAPKRSNAEGAAAKFRSWIEDTRLGGFAGHVSRGHMASDLQRYFFASAFALKHGRSPVLSDFSEGLTPNHQSARSEKKSFADRFKVQVWDKPSSTVVSHIAKDGHYYIHPDPCQMRSLSIREAARLQSFPDNYVFLGNRTQQYTQVGNAVPPYLAHQIAKIVSELVAK